MDVETMVRAFDGQIEAIDMRMRACPALEGPTACKPVPYAQWKQWRANVASWKRFRAWLSPEATRAARWTQAMERGLVQRWSDVVFAWSAWVLAWQEGGELLNLPSVNGRKGSLSTGV